MDDEDRTIEVLRGSVEAAERGLATPGDSTLDLVIHHGRRRRGRIGVSLVLAVVLVAGVGLPLYALLPLGGSRIPGGAPLKGSNEKMTSISPIADFMGGRGATSFIAFSRIEEPQIASCMRQAGWYYVAVIPTTSNSFPTEPRAAIRWAKVYGYGYLKTRPGDPATDGKALDDKNGNYQRSLSATALSGYMASLTTCRAAADKASQKSFPMFNQTLSSEIHLDQERSWSDPSFIAAEAQWSECMTQKGFSYATPDAARASFNADIQSYAGSPSEQLRERQVGYADAICSSHTVWPVVFRLETAIVRAIVSKYGREATCGASC